MTNIIMVRGDSEVFDVDLSRYNPATGLDEPITPVKAWFTAKKRTSDSDSNSVIKLDSVTNPTKVVISDGFVRIVIDPANTDSYSDKWLIYDVQIKEADGLVTTVQSGRMELVRDVTRTAS